MSNKHSTGETAEIRKQKPLDAFLCKLFIKRKDMVWGIMIPGSDDITARQKYFNPKWPPFRKKSEMKREESNPDHETQTSHIECHRAVTWIEDN